MPSSRNLPHWIAANARAARTNGREQTAPARAAFIGNWERVVDPNGVLAPEERARRAKAALKEHMLRLALHSAQKRRG